jgi:hypothetical protein
MNECLVLVLLNEGEHALVGHAQGQAAEKTLLNIGILLGAR